jgi:hypothetical protein
MRPKPTSSIVLTKTRLLSWLQCPRRLYLEIHHPELAEPSDATAAVMATGNLVGEQARAFFPEGVLIDWPYRNPAGREQAIRETAKHLASAVRRPIFEATFLQNNTLVRADVMLPEKSRWHLFEVKSSTDAKDYHVQDAAIQHYVLAQSGVKLGSVSVVTINREFVYPGNGIYCEKRRNGEVNSLFQSFEATHVTAKLAKTEVPSWIKGAQKTLAGKMPAVTENCKEPYPCPFMGCCYPEVTEYPVACLPNISKKKLAEFAEEGWIDIRDIPAGVLTNEKHERIRRCSLSGKAELDPQAAKILAKHGYPRYYLDFETIQFAVPIWKGTRPFQQIPFQWSCHIEKKDGSVEHKEFLDTSGEDPSRKFAESVIKVVGKAGPIYVYNQAFEKTRLKELAERFPDLAAVLLAINERIFDLLPVMREHYYHPAMKGSWSIKAVLPTIAPELDYSNLSGAKNGGQAQDDYLNLINPKTDVEKRESLRNGLIAYCGRDTEAIVRLAAFLAG